MKKTAATLLGFAAGAAVGAFVAVLYAPDNGKNTRDRLSYKLDKARDSLKDAVDAFFEGKDGSSLSSAQERSQQVTAEARMQAEKLMEEVEDFKNKILRMKDQSEA